MTQLFIQDSSTTPRQFPVLDASLELFCSKPVGQREAHSTTSHSTANINKQVIKAYVPLDVASVDQPNVDYVAVDFYTQLTTQCIYQRVGWRMDRSGLTVSKIGLNTDSIPESEYPTSGSTYPQLLSPIAIDIPVLVDTSTNEVFCYLPKQNTIDEDSDVGKVYNAYQFTSSPDVAYDRSVSPEKVSLGVIVPPVKLVVV